MRTTENYVLSPSRREEVRIVGAIFDKIRKAVIDDRYIVSWHADERCEEREEQGIRLRVLRSVRGHQEHRRGSGSVQQHHSTVASRPAGTCGRDGCV